MNAAIKRIASQANPRFRDWRSLVANARSAKGSLSTLIEGEHLVSAALTAKAAIRAALVRNDVNDLRPTSAAVLEAVIKTGAATFVLTPALYEQLAPVVNGSGLMCEILVPQVVALPERLDRDALLLDGIQDPGNAGALLRVAAAAGAKWIFATQHSAALWAPKVMRAAMGAHFLLNVAERVRLGAMVDAWQGVAFVAADSAGGEPLWQAELPLQPICWVFGGEGAGLSSETRQHIESHGLKCVNIPIAQGIESLNVVSAASICLFERSRRLQQASRQ